MDQNATDEVKPEPKPWEIRPDAVPAEPASTPAAAVEPTTTVTSVAAIVIASIWLVISIVAGMTFINTPDFVDDGNAPAARALGWIIIGIGVLGLLTALDRRVTRS